MYEIITNKIRNKFGLVFWAPKYTVPVVRRFSLLNFLHICAVDIILSSWDLLLNVKQQPSLLYEVFADLGTAFAVIRLYLSLPICRDCMRNR